MTGTVTSDSADYATSFYGILNESGHFWTPLPFGSEDEARQHIVTFWGGEHTDGAQRCLRTHKIVPVRIRLETLPEQSA